MAFHRGIEGSEPLRPQPITRLAGPEEERRRRASGVMAIGSLACPSCDVPVVPAVALTPTDLIRCGYCDHVAVVRDFLSLAVPTRPARVEVRVVVRDAA